MILACRWPSAPRARTCVSWQTAITAAFLQRNAPGIENPGPILNRDGKEIGRHQGLAFYTIGQRKALGVASFVPLYVLEKDLPGNALIVGPLEQLGKRQLLAGRLNWVSGEPPGASFRAQVKIRYKAQPAWAEVTSLPGDQAQVQFDHDSARYHPRTGGCILRGGFGLGGWNHLIRCIRRQGLSLHQNLIILVEFTSGISYDPAYP